MSKDTRPEAAASPRTTGSARAPYAAPVLEPLGAWSALTLQQSIPIGPGGFLPDPERTRRLA